MPAQSNDPDSPDNAPDKADPSDPADEAKDKSDDENAQNDPAKDDEGKKPEPDPNSLHSIRDDLDHAPGGLRPVDPADQQALEDAVPRNEDGTPQRHPDPFKGWSQLQNDGGNEVPGRGNNCADCSRSFLETWYGNPQVSAPRTLDPGPDGKIDLLSPEDNANDNQIRWSGAPHTYAGPASDPDTPRRIEHELLQAGPGSASIVQVAWPGGGGHAFNAVNHNGKIVWVDTQTGEVSHDPIHIPNATHAWHIPLDPDGNPLHPAKPDATNNDSGNDTQQNSQQNNTHTQTEQNSQAQQNTQTQHTPTQQPDQAQQPDQSQQSDPAAPDPTDPTDPTDNGDSTPSNATPNTDPASDPATTPPTNKPDDDTTAAVPTKPDGTTPDQSSNPDRTTPNDKTAPDRDTAQESKPDSRPDSDPRATPSIPHQQTATDPRTGDPSPSDPRTQDPRTQDPRTQDPRTTDPRRDDDTRPETKGPSKDPNPQDPNRPDDRTPPRDDAQPHTEPDTQLDPDAGTPDKSPDDAADTEPAQLNTDSTVPTRESLPQGRTADATRHIEDAVQNKKPLYGDISPANNTTPPPPPAPERPTGPAEPSGTSDDPNERARQRAGDLQKLAWANSNKPEHKKWFSDFYKENGYRIRVKKLCDDGFPAPQLHPADPPNRWMLASDVPEPEQESYTDWKPNQRDKTKLTDDQQQRLEKAAEDRRKAIIADKVPHDERDAAKKARDKNPTPENQKRFEEADAKHSPLHAARGERSEEYGDTVAEFHAMPDNFPDATRVDNRARGNNRFDQIWENPGPPPELVVVEAKGSTEAGLGERRGLPDPDRSSDQSNTPGADQQQPDGANNDENGNDDSASQDEPRSSIPRVKQGTRAYFETIVHEMQVRGDANLLKAKNADEVRAARDELALAQRLRDSLDGVEGAAKIRYMLVKGKPDGATHDGYEMSEFDIRKAEEKQRDNNSTS
ncbi:toxin glutamine deamidase domain-containing protein [Streptomyces cavernicola]|uniref:Toxin glutamine deamidase domain-containing protein n=1 Tax=Streptomyces cavernicola TaxID=3043613 RepID=A0ABT6SG95_9ACTN|nr:toxin glutamine deamidase domain-containing protein [Streptomyces sp. B-S-A6]MDI3407185.1 toxin glutamine deamidase domain-containing protein [Streptomyces sp. B-S-A6]